MKQVTAVKQVLAVKVTAVAIDYGQQNGFYLI